MNQQMTALPVAASPIMAPAGKTAKVFVSYSRKDMAFAQELVAALVENGFDAFLDKTDIAPGEPWKERLAGLIAAADTIVFAVSPDSVASSICAWELDESARLGKRLIPIVARRIADADAPEALGRLNWIFCTADDDKGAALVALDQALHTDLPWVREHTRLGELARRWDAQSRTKGATLRGADLEAAERWLDRRPADANAPTDLHQDFIRASRRTATGRQRAWVAGSVVVACIALALAGLAEVSRREAQHQRGRAEAAATEAKKQRDAAEAASREAQRQRSQAEAAAIEAKKQRDAAEAATREAQAQRKEAEAQRKEAVAQKKVAERNLAAAKKTVDGLIFKIAQGLRNVSGMRVETVRTILETVSGTVDELIASAPEDRELLHSRAAMLSNFADTYIAAGDLRAARAAAEQSLAIARKLAAREPDNAQLQGDVSTSLDKLGDLKVKGGDLAGALADYQKGLDIRQKLAAQYPDDAEGQRAVSISLEKVGDVKQQAGDQAGALAAYSQGLAIFRRLSERNPTNAEAHRAVLIGLEKIGDVKLQARDQAGALAAYQQSLDIAQKLAAQQPGNALAQRDLSGSLDRIGDVKMKAGDHAGALAAYTQALDIRQKLAAQDPDNADTKRNMALSLDRIGDAKMQAGDRDGAHAAYAEALTIARKLAVQAPDNAGARWDLVVSLVKVASFSAQPAPIYHEALGIVETLDREGRLAPSLKWAIEYLRKKSAESEAAQPNR